MSPEEFNKFHQDLVQWIADYLKDKDYPKNAWMLSLTIDDFQTLMKYGKWTPYNDSYLGFINNHGDEIIWEM